MCDVLLRHCLRNSNRGCKPCCSCSALAGLSVGGVLPSKSGLLRVLDVERLEPVQHTSFPLNSKCRNRSPSVLLCVVWWWKLCLINYRTDGERATNLYPAFAASPYVLVCCRFRFSASIFGGAVEAGGRCSGVASELGEGRGRVF